MAREITSIRAFLAIPLPDEVKVEIEKIIFALKKQEEAKVVRWVKPENMHLTLRFLGETKIEDLEKLTHSIQKNLTHFHSFTFTLSHIDLFPKHHPHVVAIYIQPNDSLVGLNNLLESIVIGQGYLAETREFFPHITVGRLRYRKKNFSLDLSRQMMGRIIAVREIILYESLIGVDGVHYGEVVGFELLRS